MLGCNPSLHVDDKTTQSSDGKPGNVDKSGSPTSIVAVPRPNSGRYSTEEATKLLPGFLERSTPVLSTDPVVTRWKSPTQGIRVHVAADDTVEIIDYLGRKLVGVDSIESALDSTITYGNERSVLLASEVAGWETPTKRTAVELLFQPSVQIYIVDGT